jgi:tRNA modification GTPase
VRDGLKLVIAGLPNAGKSSLMNMLSGYNRSIVTDIPGTTRDTVDEFVQIDGVPIIITDTAGIRETDDTVEKIGVERAFEKIEEADLVVYVADCLDFADNNENGVALRQEHIANVSRLTTENAVVIINKTDLDGEDGNASKKAEEFFKDFTCIKASILENKGVEPVFDIIKTRFIDGTAGYGSQNIITNIRHKTLIDEALSLLTAAEESHLNGMPLDCVSYDVRLCSEKLGEIIGKNISEDVIHDIFSRFCLGK